VKVSNHVIIFVVILQVLMQKVSYLSGNARKNLKTSSAQKTDKIKYCYPFN
jgi:hypothetical protein